MLEQESVVVKDDLLGGGCPLPYCGLASPRIRRPGKLGNSPFRRHPELSRVNRMRLGVMEGDVSDAFCFCLAQDNLVAGVGTGRVTLAVGARLRGGGSPAVA